MTIGLDIGTMNLVKASFKNDKKTEINFDSTRNVFIKVNSNRLGQLDLNQISHAYIDDELFFLSESAYDYCNIFGLELNRPMHKGLISATEIDATDVLLAMIQNLIGKSKDNELCVYSCPAANLNSDDDIIYHDAVLSRIITTLGFQAKSINEGLSIIYSNCHDSDLSGIAISYGAGMTNITIAFHALPILEFSLPIAGDWIDQQVSKSSKIVTSRVISIKEDKNFIIGSSFKKQKNKKIKKVHEALTHFYTYLINQTIISICKALSDLSDDIHIPSTLPIIISGGTSKANNFMSFATQKFNEQKDDFMFDISYIRHATDPLNAVADGCLLRGMIYKDKKL